VSTLPRGKQCSFESEALDTNCPNCFVLKEQLEIATQELKSARTIISLLKEDSNLTCDFPAVDCPLQGQPTVNIQSATDLNWNTVTGKANKKKVSTPNNIWKTKLQLASTNRFSPLDNLKVHPKKKKNMNQPQGIIVLIHLSTVLGRTHRELIKSPPSKMEEWRVVLTKIPIKTK
jgi:hypothetical protein